MGRLDGKVAIISGGARGQGVTEAWMMSREGAKVVFGDILDDEGKKVEAEIAEAGYEATYIHLDVTKEDDWRSAIAAAVERYGKLDILVNNAAILLPNTIEDTPEEEWDRIMAVNAKGVFLGTKTRDSRHAPGRWRVHHQHLFSGGTGGQSRRLAQLLRYQGSRPTLQQDHRHPARQGQHPMQLGPSRSPPTRP